MDKIYFLLSIAHQNKYQLQMKLNYDDDVTKRVGAVATFI